MTDTPTQILDPTVGDAEQPSVPRPPRLEAMAGARMGLVANGKTHSEVILSRIAANLDARHGLGKTTTLTKPSPGRPVAGAELDMLAEHAMAIVAAIGD